MNKTLLEIIIDNEKEYKLEVNFQSLYRFWPGVVSEMLTKACP